jgi:DNA-binding MarR family transcriptional regulator
MSSVERLLQPKVDLETLCDQTLNLIKDKRFNFFELEAYKNYRVQEESIGGMKVRIRQAEGTTKNQLEKNLLILQGALKRYELQIGSNIDRLKKIFEPYSVDEIKKVTLATKASLEDNAFFEEGKKSVVEAAEDLRQQELQKAIGFKSQPIPLSYSQASALSVIRDVRQTSQAELAQKLHLEPASIVTLIDELEKLGLAERHVHKNNRRKYQIKLTNSGKTIASVGSARITVQPGVGQVVQQQPGISLVDSWNEMIKKRLETQLITEQENKTYVTEGYMQLAVDKNNLETPFSYPIRPLTNKEVTAAGGKVRTIPKEDAQKAISLYEAYRGLQYTDTLYKHLDNPTTIPQRLSNWFDTTLARYTGNYNAKVAMAEMDRALISRAVEAINSTEMRNDPTVGYVKEVFSGKLVDARVGRQAVAQLLDRVRDKLAVYVGVENIPDIKETLQGTKVPGVTTDNPYPGLKLGTGKEKKALPR